METNAPKPPVENSQEMTEGQILLEILENSRATKRYMKWSLYITIILVVLPLLAAVFLIPMAMNSLTNTYGSLILPQ